MVSSPINEALSIADTILSQMAVLGSEERAEVRNNIALAIEEAWSDVYEHVGEAAWGAGAPPTPELTNAKGEVLDLVVTRGIFEHLRERMRSKRGGWLKDARARIAQLERDAATAPIWCWASVDAEGSHRAHTWGFSHSREDALAAAQSGGWLHSEGGRYSHVVVEKVGPRDIYKDREEVWFALPDKGARVEPCEKPEKLAKVVAFTIG